MGAALRTMLGVEKTKTGAKGFKKKKLGGSTFYVADCVSYTAEQLGLDDGGPAFTPGMPVTAANKKSSPRWKNGVVPFRFVSTFTNDEKNLFKRATKMWEDATHTVRFVEDKEKKEPTFVRVTRISQQQNIASNGAVADAHIQIGFWNVGSIAHELGHVLGLAHEHQRSDRDQFVTISAAVSTNANFRKHEDSEDDLRTDYDFESIMHYGEKVMLNGAAVTALTPKHGFEKFKGKMGQRSRISAKDAEAIAAMYG